MKPYGLAKTKNRSKNSKHRDCAICEPAKPNKKKARQDNKKQCATDYIENPYIFYDPYFE